MINIIDKAKCTGCSACKNICPKEAIEMESDFAGFYYPKVDKDKCIDCSLCEKVCPLQNSVDLKNNFTRPLVKAVWNLDEQIRINSTSGGAFSSIAEKFLEDGGYVVGAIYSDSFEILHTIISNKEDIKSLRQSKYAQSNLYDIFAKIKKLLSNEQKVMFCGSPCQVAGLRQYLGNEYDNLYLIDFICRGIISQKIYRNYLESVEKHTGAAVTKIHFKNKDFGWNRFSTKISLNNGDSYHKDRYNDEYMLGYLKYNLYLRPCCHECKFKTLPRVSDITLGDFWGIGNKNKQLDNDKGTSVVLINSGKGNKLFEATSELLFSCDSTIDQVTKGNSCLFNIVPKGKYSDYFYKKFTKVDFIDLIHKIDEKALWDRKDLSIKDRLYIIKEKIKGNR